jgi:thermitase
MLITGIATVAAFILVARAASKPGGNPVMMLTGITLFTASLAGHFVFSDGLLSSAAALSAEIGVGFMLGAGILKRNSTNARPWFYLGSVALTTGVLLFVILRNSGNTPGIAAPGTSTPFVSYLVELGPDDVIQEIESVLNEFGVSYERAFPGVSLDADENLAQVYLLSVPRENILSLTQRLLSDKENVDMIALNRRIGLDEPVPTSELSESEQKVLEDDPYVKNQWGLNAIRGHEAHALLKDANPVRKARVAIVDTGVDANHEDIRGTFAASPGDSDLHGHGSHCAGIAGAFTNNGLGIASLNWEGRFVEVSGYKALNDQGFGSVETIAQAIIDASRDDADVISMSLGDRSPTPPKTIADAVAFAQRSGAIVVVSAGNSNEDAKWHMPSNIQGVIVVSAVNEQLEKASFSNTNTSLKRPIAAPGVNILSLKSRGGYVEMSGTSMSTPMVSGLIGVMRSLDPEITAGEVYDVLQKTGISLKDSKEIGKLINAEEAIKTVL